MTASATPPAHRSSLKRVAFASGVGTSLEFYDFAIYGTATALVFTDTFFKTDDAWFGTFMGLATFGIGFLMAPLGAVLFGWVGDRVGRRRALQLTFIGMGAATLLMGMLPTYAQIGIAAPILLVVLRLVHGLSRGGETGGAAVLAIEHAPPQKRAQYGMFTAFGSPVGTILAIMYTYFSELFPREQRQSGMGIAFHVGAVLGGGIAPLVANRIMAATGDAKNIGYYLAGTLLISLVCLLVLPETAPARLASAATKCDSAESSEATVDRV
jgi:MFS family permease